MVVGGGGGKNILLMVQFSTRFYKSNHDCYLFFSSFKTTPYSNF